MKEIIQEIKEGNLQEALQLCNTRLNSDEYNLDVLDLKAVIFRKLSDYNSAIETHNTLINLLPDRAAFYAERGMTFHAMLQKDEAIADFNKALLLDPKNPYRYSSRAFIRDYYGDHAGALEDYNKAIDLDPQDAISLNNRGVIEEKLGRLEKAKSSFDKSDKITGVDQKIANAIPSENLTKDDHTKPLPTAKHKGKLNLEVLIKTIKSLLFSSAERKNFLNFLRIKK